MQTVTGNMTRQMLLAGCSQNVQHVICRSSLHEVITLPRLLQVTPGALLC